MLFYIFWCKTIGVSSPTGILCPKLERNGKTASAEDWQSLARNDPTIQLWLLTSHTFLQLRKLWLLRCFQVPFKQRKAMLYVLTLDPFSLSMGFSHVFQRGAQKSQNEKLLCSLSFENLVQSSHTTLFETQIQSDLTQTLTLALEKTLGSFSLSKGFSHVFYCSPKKSLNEKVLCSLSFGNFLESSPNTLFKPWLQSDLTLALGSFSLPMGFSQVFHCSPKKNLNE